MRVRLTLPDYRRLKGGPGSPGLLFLRERR